MVKTKMVVLFKGMKMMRCKFEENEEKCAFCKSMVELIVESGIQRMPTHRRQMNALDWWLQMVYPRGMKTLHIGFGIVSIHEHHRYHYLNHQ